MMRFIKWLYRKSEDRRDRRAMRRICRDWGHHTPGKNPVEICRRCGAEVAA